MTYKRQIIKLLAETELEDHKPQQGFQRLEALLKRDVTPRAAI